MKKAVSIILAVTMALGCVCFASAEHTTAKLYNTYGDGMLFKQNDEAILAGTASANAEITAELCNGSGEVVASGKSSASADGTFEVSFNAPQGGYEEYSIVLKENSAEFDTLENVVFGELWLASGQSNMQYPLAQSRTGRDMFANSQKLSKWLRILLVPAYPGNTTGPEFTYADPQQDIVGAQWVTGENSAIYGMSAVAYFFAADLMEKLDMPVGVLNASLGGSSITSWLSRVAIDGDEKVKEDFISNDLYIEKSEWDTTGQNVYVDMTANYNHKIEALKHFRPSGMIWYQGESDIHWRGEMYTNAFDLMQRSYSELFGYEDALMPIIYTQMASYLYSNDGLVLLDRNIEYSEMQKLHRESRATVTIYDLPLTYIPEAGSIHPECKEEIGQRMAFAANSLVYGGSDSYTAATVKSTEIRDGSVYVTFDNTGDGLMADGVKLYGFAVCGADGIYIQADAEIVSADTVRIWSVNVPKPCSATYAYCISNMRSNLYASSDGNLALPVCPFVTDSSIGTHYWFDRQWTDCEDEQTWHTMSSEKLNKYYDSWAADGADISFNGGAMNITSDNEKFSVSPLMTCKDSIKTVAFGDMDSDYSDYGKMSFIVRNNGTENVSVSEIRFYKNSFMWYSPAVDGTKDVETVIPADGEWHVLTFDLNRLYLFGNEGGASSPCGRLGKVNEIRFVFSAEGEGDISIDSVRFAPSNEDAGIRFDSEMNNADNFVEIISAVFAKIINTIISIFK
ncbi:MAG: hypothetical protein E7547_08945 [Ruminococcaceae bacterium]|nr:hypothetical protein [Oscillospiraceae bacterium]